MIKSSLRIGALLATLHGTVAYGQNAQPVIPLTGSPPTPVSGSNPLPVSGTFSATLGGFQPSAAGARGTPLAVTTSDSSGALPTGTVVITSNPGANLMYCNVNGVAATASDQPITSGGGWFAFTLPTGATTLHCIAPGGATTANTLGGTGLPTGTGGGGGGGGGGGSSIVFGATVVGNPAANPPVLVGGTVDGTAAGNVGIWKVLAGIGSVNTAQVNGVTTLAGAGAVGAGALRVAVGQDATTVAGSALGLTVGSPLFVSPGTGASFATSALQTTGNTALTTINTTLGTPFQAGGSIGNTSFTATQATGTNLHMVCDSGCAGSGGTASAFGAVFPANGTAIGLTTGGGSPLMTAWAATSNFGTAPSAIPVPAVNSSDAALLAAVNSSIPAGTNVISKGDAATGGLTDAPCTPPLVGTPSCSNNGALKALVNLANSPAQITSLTRAARNFPGCTVGVSSALCLAANTAVTFLQVQNTSTTATVACGFGVTAVIGGSTSFTLAPGQPANWGPMTGGVPTGQMNCISSSGSTPFYVEWL